MVNHVAIRQVYDEIIFIKNTHLDKFRRLDLVDSGARNKKQKPEKKMKSIRPPHPIPPASSTDRVAGLFFYGMMIVPQRSSSVVSRKLG
jgi:hypothetical protein